LYQIVPSYLGLFFANLLSQGRIRTSLSYFVSGLGCSVSRPRTHCPSPTRCFRKQSGEPCCAHKEMAGAKVSIQGDEHSSALIAARNVSFRISCKQELQRAGQQEVPFRQQAQLKAFGVDILSHSGREKVSMIGYGRDLNGSSCQLLGNGNRFSEALASSRCFIQPALRHLHYVRPDACRHLMARTSRRP